MGLWDIQSNYFLAAVILNNKRGGKGTFKRIIMIEEIHIYMTFRMIIYLLIELVIITLLKWSVKTVL